ncbi:MAG: bifunctional amidotransferase subunit GatB/aspartate--tRNA ligase AspS [Tannerella sp.]|jgi:aspartyl-tRNA synthetase|nr:bifunctional amidotransferase subunit GatB/aspartate--tRNA ligase AspS [Tannerella sp.]
MNNLPAILQKLSAYNLEVVMGLETHIRLNTASKLFCPCANTETHTPNVNICPVCTGQPGALPVLNKEAVIKAIRFGKAVHSSFKNNIIRWDRKHYEYPDLANNYQLTQFQHPVIPDGYIRCYRKDGAVFQVDLAQVHIEEDAAKLMHEKNQTLVDFNKASVPLIEVVTKPCIHDIEDVAVYAQNLQRIVQTLKISNANLEKGEYKSDVSVSLRRTGSSELNPRTEIKNLNSFKFMIEAIMDEVEKQLDYFVAHNDFRPDQTTVLFDSDTKQTKTMRKKEYAADYRYTLDPNIYPVNITDAVNQYTIEEALLPFEIETVMIHAGVRPQDAKFFTSATERSSLFSALNAKINDPLFVTKTLVNNVKEDQYPYLHDTDALCYLFEAYQNQKISIIVLQEALQNLISAIETPSSFDYKSFIDGKSISGEALDEIIHDTLSGNRQIAGELQSGNFSKIGVLVGIVIRATGKAVSGKLIKDRILSQLSVRLKQSGEAQPVDHPKSEVVHTGQTRIVSSDVVILKDQYRTHFISDISIINLFEDVILSGWVSSVRDHGELVFIDLRDSTQEIFQVRATRVHLTNFDSIAKLPCESVIMVTGKIIKRNLEDYNAKIRSGEIEIDAKQIDILNIAQPLPFEIRKADKVAEGIRLKYKFLDHRNPSTHKAIVNRHKVLFLIREVLNTHNFLEIETPVLSAGTDEGAREFIVPSRKFPGKFYSLPQSPQQYKQMLMVSGYDRYFQIARCFRDEDSRGDRQAEFTQLDIEMSFVSMQDVIALNTNLFNEIVNRIYPKEWKLYPFKILTYKDAMNKYGSDRPDLRFALEMADITEIVKKTSFNVFAKPIHEGGIVKCIKVPGELSEKRLTKGQIEKLTFIAQQNGLGGLAYIIVKDDELQSPIIKYLGEDICREITTVTEAVTGDVIFFSAADHSIANNALSAVRQELGKMLNLIKPDELHPAWIVDFPQFEKTDDGGWTFSHNPFSMPKSEFLHDHLNGLNLGKILAQQYDLVLNGNEIGGGSIRAHRPEILEATYRNMGFDRQSMRKSIGHMLDAFQYGAPPHGGIAWGVDRLMMILEEKTSIREVIAFPKTGSGEELLFGSPSTISDKKIQEANIVLSSTQIK